MLNQITDTKNLPGLALLLPLEAQVAGLKWDQLPLGWVCGESSNKRGEMPGLVGSRGLSVRSL